MRVAEDMAMKKLLICLAVVLCGASLARAQLKPILKVSIEKDQKTQREIRQKAKVQTSWDAEYHTPEVADSIRSVVLTIKIQNMSGVGLKGATVKYAVFGKELTGQKIALAVQGKTSIDVPALQTAQMQTDPASFESEEVKFKTGEFTERNRQTGQRYYGVAIAIFSGTQRLTTYYEPDAVEQAVAKYKIDF
jgi:hypothetical protein